MATLRKMTTVRWINAAGKRCRPDDPGAQKQVIESKKWYAVWQENGKLHKVPLSANKREAERLLVRLLQQREERQAGLDDNPRQEDDLVKGSLENLLVRVLADQRQRGVAPKSSLSWVRRVRRIAKGCHATSFSQFTVDRVDGFLDALEGSCATRKAYRKAVITLGNFLVAKKKLLHNPLTGITKPSGDRVYERRALTVAEVRKLLVSARVRPVEEIWSYKSGFRKGQRKSLVSAGHRAWAERIGHRRALLYKLALYTGLRRGEIRHLTPGDIDFEKCILRLPGKYTKNGKDAVLLLFPAFAQELRAWAQTRSLGETLIPIRYKDLVTQLKKDLEHAGIPYKDSRGRVVDFHALRKTANTLLGVAGISAQVRQLFLRHSDIRLTTTCYSDETLYDLGHVALVLESLNLDKSGEVQ